MNMAIVQGIYTYVRNIWNMYDLNSYSVKLHIASKGPGVGGGGGGGFIWWIIYANLIRLCNDHEQHKGYLSMWGYMCFIKNEDFL